MAVTLTTSACKQPDGELFAALFPDDDIDTLLTGWLQSAIPEVAKMQVASADQNNAAQAWVYYRGYQHINLRLQSSPSSRIIHSGAGDATISSSGDQRKYFKEKEGYWFNMFYGYSSLKTADAAAVPAFFGRVRARTCGTLG